MRYATDHFALLLEKWRFYFEIDYKKFTIIINIGEMNQSNFYYRGNLYK